MLSFTPALAADVSALFPAKTEYTGFSDVPASAWYASAVKVCCETGLMQGTDNGFNPEGNLTVAEMVTIAARIYATLNGETVPQSAEGAPWYEGAQTYLTGLCIYLPEDMNQEATRFDFISLLSNVVPNELLPPINSITSIHDIKDENILTFYNAGILTGTDTYGSFSGGSYLTRAESATMVARILRPCLRQSFTLAEYSHSMFFSVFPKIPYF